MTTRLKGIAQLLRSSQFALLLLLLIVVTLGSFVLTGPLGWAAGILYIAYDTWLLSFVAWKTTRSLDEGGRASPPRPARRLSLTVLVPARDEASSLPACLDALKAQTSPPEEVWVIDDGSTDGTAEMLADRFGVRWSGAKGRSETLPWLKALRRAHSGKARSLNAVWPLAEGAVVVTIDADTILEPEAVASMRGAFEADPKLAAACGVLEPRCRRGFGGAWFELFQTFEYIRAFLARFAWMRCEALLLVSGAFAAYRKDLLKALGGYDPESLVEDYDLIHRLYRHSFTQGPGGLGLKVGVVAAARATTDAPHSVRAFLKQRQRWFSGFLQTQFKNRDMVGNPAFGPVGLLMMPIKAADTLQPIYGLVAFAILVGFLLQGGKIPLLILWIIGVKLALDLAFHFWSVALYHRWQGRRASYRTWGLAALATLTEPVSFQLLRHTGALLGWIGFLRGGSDWTPQREAPEPSLQEGKMRSTVLAAACLPLLAGLSLAASFQDGLQLKKAERFEEAARVFESLVEKNPKDGDSLEQLATLQGWLGRHAESVTTWERAVALNPRNDDYRLGLARVLYWRGERKRALRELRHVLGGRPRDVDAITLAGDVSLAEGDIRRAREYYLKAKQLAPADAELDKKLARAIEPVRWRLDVGYTYDHYTNFRQDEYSAFGQAGYAFSKDASVWVRQDRLRQFGMLDHFTQAGGALKPARWLLLLPSAGLSPEHNFRAKWQADAGFELPVTAHVTPLLNLRHFQYPDGKVQMLLAGARLDASRWVSLEYRYGFSYNIDRSRTGGYSLRANAYLGEGWWPYVGYAHGTENIPPQASAKVTYYSAGLVCNIGRSWGARFDYSYEDRPSFYQHHSEGLGLTYKF